MQSLLPILFHHSPLVPRLQASRKCIHTFQEKLEEEAARSQASFYMQILQVCIEKRAKRKGHSVHTHVITNGFGPSLNLGTKLIIFYTKVGDASNARKVFNRMPDRSIVSWTAQISGYVRNGCYEDALLMFMEMHHAGVKANQFTFGSVLRACTGLGCLDGGLQIQGCIHKGRFFEDLFVQSALIDLHSKCGDMRDACCLFETMSELNMVAWNAMIGGYAIQGYAEDSFRMFGSLIRGGMIPDCFTLGNVLKASCSPTSIVKVRQIHVFITKLGLESDTTLSGSLLDAYVKCENIGSAYQIYKSKPNKDVISCTALITGYAHNVRNSGTALDIFKEIQQKFVKVDNVIICSLLKLCANVASLGWGIQLHALALKCCMCDVAVGNALINMYAKSGDIENANQAFHEMDKRNVISWTSLIGGYGMHGYGHEAVALYKKMQYESLKPNDITFLTLLFACSHSGLTNEGWECFNNMVNKYNILPRAKHFSCVVDLFARGGQLEEAYNILCKLNVKPNASLWGSILGACSVYGNTSLGELAAAHLFNVDPENSVNYIVLSHIYASSGAWNAVWRTRRLLYEGSLKTSPGYSLLQCPKERLAFLQPS